LQQLPVLVRVVLNAHVVASLSPVPVDLLQDTRRLALDVAGDDIEIGVYRFYMYMYSTVSLNT